jgi:hypothetical protein
MGTSFDMGSDYFSEWIPVHGLRHGSFQVSWSGLDATDSTMFLQGTDDQVGFGQFGDDFGGITITSLISDSQIWEFTVFTTKYIRLAYTANSVTTGTANYLFEGRK